MQVRNNEMSKFVSKSHMENKMKDSNVKLLREVKKILGN